MAEASNDIETAIGPGTVAERPGEVKSKLEGIGEQNFVELLNPMSVTFIGQAALTTNINAPMTIGATSEEAPGLTKTENDIRQVYGFDLRAQAQITGKTHILNRIPIESGKTVRLLGSEAKVVLGQMVTAMLQREKKSNLVANPDARREVEERIVQRVGTIASLMGSAPMSVHDQMKTALDAYNEKQEPPKQEESHGEDEFPGLSDSGPSAGPVPEQSNSGQPASDTPGKRGPGRPKAPASA